MGSDATVTIVDDDESVRDSLRWMLESVNLTVESYGSAEDFLDNFMLKGPGCLILDVRMPGMSGLELQEMLARKQIPIPVLILTGHGDIPMAVQAMSAGAFGFSEKPFDGKELLAEINNAIEHSRKLISQKQELDSLQSRLDQLTPRETQVLECIVAGQANKVIAGELGIVQRTVEVHRHNVMEKMQASSVAELIQMVLSLK